MRQLPVGVPKVMVSTVASGDVKPYVGPSDICMMYSVTDIAGINRISEKVLANAAHALAGMIAYAATGRSERTARPAIGLTMFGLTTPCVQAVTRALENDWDCLVFHATGTGGQSMEKLVDSGLLAGGDRRHDHRDRRRDRGRRAHAPVPSGSTRSSAPACRTSARAARSTWCNFWAMDTVPERFRGRRLHRHNAERHADAHVGRRVRAHRRASSPTSSTGCRGRCAS